MKQIESFNGLRFFAALIIILFHIGDNINVAYPFVHGRMAVELFFILAGFLLVKTYEKLIRTNHTPLGLCKTYFFQRVIKLFPEYFVAILIAIFLFGTFSKVKTLQPFFLNVFMLAGWGKIHNILPSGWYIPVLFWCGSFLFCLLVLEKNRAKAIILPALAILCCFHLINIKSHFAGVYGLTLGYLTTGTIRGLLAIIIGIYTYWGCQELKLHKAKWNPKFVSTVLLIGELFSVIGLGHIFIFQKKYSPALFNAYFYISFLIGLLYFKKEKLLKFLSWKIWVPFGKISYSLYLVHGIVIKILTAYCLSWMGIHRIMGTILIVFLSLILATSCYCSTRYLFKNFKKIAFKK